MTICNISPTGTDHCPAKKLKPNPTIKPFHPFDSNADAKSLYKAMKGGGTDEQTIIDILTHRTYEQRDWIRNAFYKNYDDNLRVWLSDEVSGVFETIIDALMYPPTALWSITAKNTD